MLSFVDCETYVRDSVEPCGGVFRVVAPWKGALLRRHASLRVRGDPEQYKCVLTCKINGVFAGERRRVPALVEKDGELTEVLGFSVFSPQSRGMVRGVEELELTVSQPWGSKPDFEVLSLELAWCGEEGEAEVWTQGERQGRFAVKEGAVITPVEGVVMVKYRGKEERVNKPYVVGGGEVQVSGPVWVDELV